MLQKSRVTAFTFSELLRENQQGRGEGGGRGKIIPPARLGLTSNITTTPSLSAFVIISLLVFCRLRNASQSDFVRSSRGSFLYFEDFIS